MEYPLDTDAMGTFSGEVERVGSALECARRKCLIALDILGSKVEYCLASEGSFGPHPFIPFLPCDQEILYFIDRRREFHLHMTYMSEKTNYQMKSVSSFEELTTFAEAAQFPTHALIIRSDDPSQKTLIYKGIHTQEALVEAFAEALLHSRDKKVWVETDMRAQHNPTRMSVIGELATKLATRLATACPTCHAPGWGRVNAEKGLRCEYCDQETEMIAHEAYGCVLCQHTETKPRADGLKTAPQQYCNWCNP